MNNEWKMILFKTQYDIDELSNYGIMILQNKEGKLKFNSYYQDNCYPENNKHLEDLMIGCNLNRESDSEELNEYLVNTQIFDNSEELFKNLKNLSKVEIKNSVYVINILCYLSVLCLCEKLNYKINFSPIR